LALAGMATLAAAPRAFAETFPDRPVKIVVPFAPGSATDLTARGLGSKLKPGASGQLQGMFPDLPQALSQIEAGRVRGLGVTGPTRTSVAPDLPAIAESVPGYSLVYWLAVFAPGETPKPLQKMLADAIGEALTDPATAKAMTQGRMEISPLALDEFAAYVKKETDWWTKSIRAAGIEPE
jgi:tripartite-type tricarboxylate transporter receptor subunit TctC